MSGSEPQPFYCTECDWTGYEDEVDFGPPVPLPPHAPHDTEPMYMDCPECGGEVEAGKRSLATDSGEVAK